ncbi:hypothetical protein MOQ_005016 [Trypanosoma cruzi marinkellei]|uniref:Uncharacterized protein n=1 Tax=Trypanosoma cruzi marinkellei TaxID=85056 RepID=K2N8R4_TRYCR|nr:hypothetical protein MOQ_005016 [Trypanosoma cruzi marinkellei]
MRFFIFLRHVAIKHTTSLNLESPFQRLLAGLFLLTPGPVRLFFLREDLVKLTSNDVRLLRTDRNVFKKNEPRQILLDRFDVGNKSPLGDVLLGCRLLALLLPLLGQATHLFRDFCFHFLNLMDPLPPLATPLPHDGLSPLRLLKLNHLKLLLLRLNGALPYAEFLLQLLHPPPQPLRGTLLVMFLPSDLHQRLLVVPNASFAVGLQSTVPPLFHLQSPLKFNVVPLLSSSFLVIFSASCLVRSRTTLGCRSSASSRLV